jgi:hypothetical protein
MPAEMLKRIDDGIDALVRLTVQRVCPAFIKDGMLKGNQSLRLLYQVDQRQFLRFVPAKGGKINDVVAFHYRNMNGRT